MGIINWFLRLIGVKPSKKEEEFKKRLEKVEEKVDPPFPDTLHRDPEPRSEPATPTPSPTPQPAPTPAPAPATGPADDPAPSAPTEPATLEDVFAKVEISCLGQPVPRMTESSVITLDPVGVAQGRNVLPIRFGVPAFPPEHRAKLVDAMSKISNWSTYPAGLEVVLIDYTETDTDQQGALNFDTNEPVDFDAGFRHPMRIDPVFRPSEDTEANTTRYWVAFIDEEAMEVEVRIPFEVVGPFKTEATNNIGDPYNPSTILCLMDFGNLAGARWGFSVPLVMADPRLSQ